MRRSLTTDPRELRNVAHEDAPNLGFSQRELDQVSVQARTGPLTALDVDLGMDKAAQKRLKALGYASG